MAFFSQEGRSRLPPRSHPRDAAPAMKQGLSIQKRGNAMKRAVYTALMLAVAMLISHTSACGQIALGSGFTFQGQLKDEGLPTDGDYDFVFRLFDAETGGAQIGGDVTVDAWPVVDGLFTLQLDFGSGAFGSDARWIAIDVRAAGSGDYTTLLPRQPVTAAPVAQYALAGPGSAGYWAENGTAIYNTNAGNVGVSTASPLFNLHVYDMVPAGEIQPPTTFGVGWRQALYPTPPHEWFYFAVGGAGPISGSGTRLIRESGTEFHFQTQDEILSDWPSTQMVLDAGGYVGIGVMDPAASLDAYNGDGYPAVKGVSAGTGIYGLHDSGSGTLPGIWGATDSGSSNAVAVRGNVTSTSPGSYSSGVRGHNNGVGGTGIGVWGSQDGSGWGVYGSTPSGRGVYGTSTDGTGVYGSSTNGYAGYFSGTVRVGVLEIVGADVAEKFPFSEDPADARPGTVMEIDPENPGMLRVARGAYNRRVAGVVSGAGDIPAGTILGNMPGSEDSPAIALNGRVWVHCDASQSSIEVGDLLTTSETSGHAMAVSDFSRAHGAVIGKAMTPLARGATGTVLVLVNLQ